MKNRSWTALVVLVLFTGYSQPLTPMVRISGTVVYPGGAEIDTTWWRVGVILARSQSASELVVYREPEVWLVDRGSAQGSHLTDPGPRFGFHMPVSSLRGDLKLSGALLGLELGQEREFMAAQGVKPQRIGVAPAVTHYLYRDSETGVIADLEVDEAGLPVRIALRQAGVELVSVVYDSYQTGLPVNEKLFDPPEGVPFRNLN